MRSLSQLIHLLKELSSTCLTFQLRPLQTVKYVDEVLIVDYQQTQRRQVDLPEDM